MSNDNSQSLEEQLNSITSGLEALPQIRSNDLRNTETRQALVQLMKQMTTTNSNLTDAMASAVTELSESNSDADESSDDDDGGLL